MELRHISWLLLWLSISNMLEHAMVNASIIDYFLPNRESPRDTDLEVLPTVPYELNERDEKFLVEAAKLANIQLSELDLCHHRVILTLRKSCNELNAEQMGKLAVMLLNCQSSHEGRQLFPCSDNMTLKECTGSMDPDVWNAYHLITNRVKAVCSSVRHEQFRGLTEMTVNKLMNTAHEQISLMKTLQVDQEKLRKATEVAIDEMSENSEKLIAQQNDLMLLSSTQRAKVESNLRELVREKSLIKSGQIEVANLLTGLKQKIDESLRQLDLQARRSKLQYDSILDDLQASASKISNKIDETTDQISTHQQVTVEQYEYTLQQLHTMNKTIYSLTHLVTTLQNDFEQKMLWVAEKVGGTSYLMHRLNTILFHATYILMGMLILVFLNADTISRILFIFLVPCNFCAAMLDFYSLDVIQLTVTIVTLIFTNYTIRFFRTKNLSNIFSMKPNEDVTDHLNETQNNNGVDDAYEKIERYKSFTQNTKIYETSSPRELINRTLYNLATSPGSRKSATPFSTSLSTGRIQCVASTAKGGQCKNAALQDGDFCKLHQRLYRKSSEDD